MARKYIPSQKHLEAVELMASKGVSQSKMAKALKISYATFQRNLRSFEEYIKKGKDTVDEKAVKEEIALVVKSLVKKCIGYEYRETTEETRVDDKGRESTVSKIVTKQVQPSDQAIFYYLGNRDPDNWHSVNHAPEKKDADDVKLTPEETRAFMLLRSSGE